MDGSGRTGRRNLACLGSGVPVLGSRARELIAGNFERGDQGRLIDGFMDRLGAGELQ